MEGLAARVLGEGCAGGGGALHRSGESVPCLAGLCMLRVLSKFHRQPGPPRGSPALPTALTHRAPANPGCPTPF